MRTVVYSVTNFLFYQDEVLMLLRSADRTVDAGKLNGIGGKLEGGENYLEAAIRETHEETGYIVSPADICFAGIITLSGGYPEDWVMCFFKISVTDKKIPKGTSIPDGKLLWIPKNAVLTSPYELVDDLHYCWKEIIAERELFFAHSEVDTHEKVKVFNSDTLPY